MPQERKHTSSAERQAAYRARCEQVRRQSACIRGLPPLPCVPSIPGWARWNATLRMAHDLIEGALSEMQDYYNERSDAWQQSERGEQHQERTACAETVLETLEPLIS